MFNNRAVLALVPARGGSKGIPRKNVCIVNGKPLVMHTLEAALHSKFIDDVYLSSDDSEILDIGTATGVHALRRPDAAASDTATADDVVTHFIGSIPRDIVTSNPYIIYLQPTSPLRTAVHIDAAFIEMEIRKSDLLISVMRLNKSPYKAFSLDKDGRLLSLFGERYSTTNRQDLPETYYPNGAIYIFPLEEYVKRGHFPSEGSAPFVMSDGESIDIDTEADLSRADNAGRTTSD